MLFHLRSNSILDKIKHFCEKKILKILNIFLEKLKILTEHPILFLFFNLNSVI